MRYYSKLAAVASMAAAAGAVAVLPHAAQAATPSCGGTCVAPYSEVFGRTFVLDVKGGTAQAGQPVILYKASNHDQAEDWTYSEEGTTADFEAAGLVGHAVALHYGTDPAYELEYSPNGADSGLCLGVTGLLAMQGSGVSLQPCGISASTVWIRDLADAHGRFAPAINGTDLSFSHPYILAYPGNGNPTDKPRPQLFTHTLQQWADGTVFDTEMWTARTGVLH
jgi:hypothetical protein